MTSIVGEAGRCSAIDDVRRVCREWAAAAARYAGVEQRMALFRDRLPAMLARPDLLAEVLRGVVGGRPHPDLRLATTFANEFLLHQDPGGLFSLRLYLYGAGDRTFVHDHTSWGVSGSAHGRLEVVRYRRADDGVGPNRARLVPEEHRVLPPTDTETTLPFERGIHRTGNPDEGTTWMLSVYGPPARRAVMQRFDLETGHVQKVFPPRVRKRMLAEEGLRDMAAASVERADAKLPSSVSALLSR